MFFVSSFTIIFMQKITSFFKEKSLAKFGPLFIVAGSSLWALDGILRRNLYVLPPIVIVFMEHLIGSIILLPVFIKLLPEFKKILADKEKVKKIIFPIIFIGLFGGLLGTLWFTSALAKVNFISFSVVFLLQKLQPLFAIASASILLKERITKKYFIWAGLAIFSAYFVTFPGGKVVLGAEEGVLMAVLLSVGAAFAWGMSTTFSKMLLNNLSSQLGTALRFFITTIFAFVALVISGSMSVLPTISFNQILTLIVIAFSTGVLAMFLYYKGLKLTKAKIATIMELSFPLLAVFIDAFLYKTFLTPGQYFSAMVLFYAIYRVGKLNDNK